MTIHPTDTPGTRWHKLGEISKTLTPASSVAPGVGYSVPSRFEYDSILSPEWENRWSYNDTANNLVVTLGQSEFKGEAYFFQAGAGRITLDPTTNTVYGPVTTTAPGQLLVLKMLAPGLFAASLR